MDEKIKELVDKTTAILGRNTKHMRYVDVIEGLVNRVEAQQKAINEFEKEYEYEHGWQVSNAKSNGQWHKGALEGFNHVKRIFDKYFG